MMLDLSNQRFSLSNALICGRASRDVYTRADIQGPEAHASIVDCGNSRLLAFRGTKSVEDIITDVRVSRENIAGGSVHMGFYASVDTIFKDIFSCVAINDGKPLIVTGHSLGGAQAAIAAWRLKMLGIKIHSVYTFGKPRAGSRSWANAYNQGNEFPSYRVTNGTDPVPWMPWLMGGYYHEGVEIFLPPDRLGPLFVEAPSLIWKASQDSAELYRLWRDIQRGTLANIEHHPIDRYLERLAWS